MTQIEDHRRFRRIPFEALAVIHRGQDHWDTQLLDISLKGVLLTCPTDWKGEIGDVLNLELIFENGALTLSMETAVAHNKGGRLGLHCLHIGLDSMMHLRRLVELNLGDASQLNRELSALGTPIK